MNLSKNFDTFAYYFSLGILNTFAWTIIWRLIRPQPPLISLLVLSIICTIAGLILSINPKAKQAIAATLTSIAWGIIIVQI